MARATNTDRHGRGFDVNTRRLVWAKAMVATGYDPNQVRKDVCGKLIQWVEYGNQQSAYGWHIDHIKPVAAGGGDELGNLQPLQWRNNIVKGDKYPNWSCAA
jgi:hypothetical protein